MKKIQFYIAIFLIIISCSTIAATNFEVAFSPRMGARDLIITTIHNAKKSIYIAAYSFTSTAIEEALYNAYKRGIDVKIVLDKKRTTERGSVFLSLQNKKIPVRANNRYAIMHNKFMVIDENTIQLGSFNYTKAAEKSNAENVLVIYNNKNLANKYLAEWQKLWNESNENY